MKQYTPFHWLINHLNYNQTYVLICLLFTLSVVPLIYDWLQTHLNRIQLMDHQLEEIEEERTLKDLFSQIQQHRLLSYHFLSGQHQIQFEIKNLQIQVQNTLQKIAVHHPLPPATLIFEPFFRIKKVNLQKIAEKWKNLIQQMNDVSIQESESIHTNFLNDILIQFGYLDEKVGGDTMKQFADYALIENFISRIPILQENLSQLILLLEMANHKDKEFFPGRITHLSNIIDSDLTYLKSTIDLYRQHFPNLDTELTKLFYQYQQLIQDLIKLVNIHLTQNNSTISFPQLALQSDLALKIGSQIWEEGLNHSKSIFEIAKDHEIYHIWSILLLTLFLVALSFLLGLSVTFSATSRLRQLTNATHSFTNGHLSIRVPAIYQDEIGFQAEAFNRMAQKLEETINNLYNLLDGTTALAHGNLSTRIQVHHDNTEFDQVAQSFNKMAETFETIIRRLQQIGITLTTSATEIAAASKEQETIIVEQEATTREIAVAANEISSTAKEFANTMNDISLVAEQTSNFAVKGKESLTNMELVMRQMVDASSNIATKLAVLNEKAGNITSVITTITKVADQTNLLSLNASIEAEKAGEYGRSFAVIAREIRRLADQTALSTLDIEKIVNEIMTAVSSSVLGVDDFTQEIRKGVEQARTVNEQLAKIIEQVQAFTSQFELLNQGMQAQSTGAEQINEAITQLSQTAQQTSEAIHQFHKTIQELNNAANELRILTPFIN